MLCHYFYNSISVCNLTKYVSYWKCFTLTSGFLHIWTCLSFIPFRLSCRRAARGGGAWPGPGSLRHMVWAWGDSARHNHPPGLPGGLLDGPAPPVLFRSPGSGRGLFLYATEGASEVLLLTLHVRSHCSLSSCTEGGKASGHPLPPRALNSQPKGQREHRCTAHAPCPMLLSGRGTGRPGLDGCSSCLYRPFCSAHVGCSAWVPLSGGDRTVGAPSLMAEAGWGRGLSPQGRHGWGGPPPSPPEGPRLWGSSEVTGVGLFPV